MTIRRLLLLLGVAAFAVPTAQVLAQGAFPGTPSGQAPLANDPASPPVNGAASPASVGVPLASSPVTSAAPLAGSERPPGPPEQQAGANEQCIRAFLPLREEAERRGKLIKVASERHASPEEACKLTGNFGQAEIKMINYVEGRSAECGIPPQLAEQLKAGHKNTVNMRQKVCTAALQQQQKGPVGPILDPVANRPLALQCVQGICGSGSLVAEDQD